MVELIKDLIQGRLNWIAEQMDRAEEIACKNEGQRNEQEREAYKFYLGMKSGLQKAWNTFNYGGRDEVK